MQNDEKKVKKSFFQGMKAELKKVIWPTGKQTVKSTFVTIVFVLLVSAVLIVLNLFFNFLSTQWYSLILGEDTNNHPNINQVVSGDTNKENNLTDVSTEVKEENEEIEETESVEVSGEDTSIVE